MTLNYDEENSIYTSDIKTRRDFVNDLKYIEKIRVIYKITDEEALKNICDLHKERDELLKNANTPNAFMFYWFFFVFLLGIGIGYSIWS